MGKLQLRFDPNQDYQLEAVQSVIDVFEGLPYHTSGFALGDEVVPNLPPHQALSETWLYDNVVAVQQRNGIETGLIGVLDVDEGLVLEGAGNESWRYPSFTIEMETGTGKTYVYLRTIYELRKQYGFRKFIVIVPSIAIYEGVVKNFQITQTHFRALYGNEPVNLVKYDGSRLSDLRAFAASTFVELMVMTIDSFNKMSNRIFKPSEQLPGERLPYQYLQETRPILILDEPQNMESERAREALRSLHPLFALRYSATHRTVPNLLYRLTPFDAYYRNLVKKIQVDAVTERDNFNRPFLALRSIAKPKLTATLRTYVDDRGRTREADVTLAHGEDLHAKTGREEHMGGYRVVEVNAGEGFVEFENGIRLYQDETIGPSRPEIFRVQIERTIEQHMAEQERLRAQGVKVLSLFFIDRVANYVDEDGIIRRLFDEAFDRIKVRYPSFATLSPHQVREGYFSKRKKKGSDEEEAFDTTSRTKAEREAERVAFELIMRDKERLLSLDEPVSFIFAHSALKEGWDNPNVFQICTLNQTVSEMKKRQEIGRGLRLCVNQEGERVFDDDVNVLTVVANESYASYTAGLQSEYVADGVAEPPPRPTQAGKAIARRNDAVFNDERFRAFWEQLTQHTSYRIHIDTSELIERCVERLNNLRFPDPVIVVERGAFVVTEYTLSLESVSGERAQIRTRRVETTGDTLDHIGRYKTRDDLAKLQKDDRLRGFRIQSIVEAGEGSRVVFENGCEITQHEPLVFQSEKGQVPHERASLAPTERYPVFNLLDRAARETGLTRPTINQILRRLSDSKMHVLFTNPEGFAGTFITEIRNTLAKHIAGHVEFVIKDGRHEPAVLDELFPPTRSFPQKELVPGSEQGLYDQVQVDSGVERRFVEDRLNNDENVICYFKFPPAFKVSFPKVIGNYNPDWGILRRNGDGQVILRLVRETKGAEDPHVLQWPHEQRKITVAEAHFRVLGVDYRVVTDETPDWWRAGDHVYLQSQIDL